MNSIPEESDTFSSEFRHQTVKRFVTQLLEGSIEPLHLSSITDANLKFAVIQDHAELLNDIQKYVSGKLRGEELDHHKKYKHVYNICQYLILSAGALTPFINSVVPLNGNIEFVKVYTSTLGVISVVAIGILQITHAYDRSTLEDVTRRSLKREENLFRNKVCDYNLKDQEETEKLFVSRAGQMIINKFNRYYAIGRPTDTTGRSPGGDGSENGQNKGS